MVIILNIITIGYLYCKIVNYKCISNTNKSNE
jgi:hypothetical protein